MTYTLEDSSSRADVDFGASFELAFLFALSGRGSWLYLEARFVAGEIKGQHWCKVPGVPLDFERNRGQELKCPQDSRTRSSRVLLGTPVQLR
jgi:hypothetical protein